MLAYGEEKAIQDARDAGANGFVMVDLPPEEAVNFREKCQRAEYVNSAHHPHSQSIMFTLSMSYVPLIAPSTSLNRIKFLTSIADSFIYLVSRVYLIIYILSSHDSKPSTDGYNWIICPR